MYPEIFRIGSFPINTYGVFLALAFLCAILITVKLAARDGLPREKIYDLCLWMLLSSLIGSKILMLFTEPEYRDHPWQLLSLDFLRSGGVFYGGLIGGFVDIDIIQLFARKARGLGNLRRRPQLRGLAKRH